MNFDDSYDMTIVHAPAENDIDIAGETLCPECEESLFPGLSDEVMDAAIESPVTAPFVCPGCGTDCEFHIDPLPTDEIGLGVVVDRAR